MFSARTSAGTPAVGLNPNRTTLPLKSRPNWLTYSSSAFNTAVPPWGRASISSYFARAIPAMESKLSRCTGATLVTTAWFGRAMRAKAEISPGWDIPISTTARSYSGSRVSSPSMEHKRCVVHIARKAAESMTEFMGTALRIDHDTVIAGAILADVGKLLEYENADGKTRQSKRGEMLRHPFTGVALAMECGVPDAVCHIIDRKSIA